MKIVKKSQLSGKLNTMDLNITDAQFARLQGDELIQDIVPHLSPTEREFLITGIMPNEWDSIFGGNTDY